MMEYRSVIVLQDARAVRDNLVQELAKRDFSVRSCGSLAGFRHLYSSDPSLLVVLTGESDDLACDAQSVRIAAPGAVIIALGTAADAAWRMHVMAAGADACHAASIDIAELAAILLSWSRTLVHPAYSHAKDPMVSMVPLGQLDSMGLPAPSASSVLSVPTSHTSPTVHTAQRSHAAQTAQIAHTSYGAHTAYTAHTAHPVSTSRMSHMAHAADMPPMPPTPAMGSTTRTAPPYRAAHAARPPRSGQHGRSGSSRSLGPPGSEWHLDANCRVLLCPQERTLFLTATENGFLVRIATSEGQLLRRRRIASGLAMTANEGVVHGLDPRNMDVLVSRLRRKARDAGIQLPLLAVRGCGYLFAEYLTVTPSFVVPRPAPSARLAPLAPPKPLPLAEPPMRIYAPSLLAA